MDNIAEKGIISHWMKKQHGDDDYDNAKQQTSSWLNNILDIQSSTFSATDFLDNIKKDLTPNNIYTFTPRGKIIHLPRNATPIDFAYSIHTDVGNRCHKARVNQQAVALNHQLANGDIVEITTSKTSEPDIDWLNFVVSGKALSKIRQYLKEQKYDDDVKNGLQLLNLGLQCMGYNEDLDEYKITELMNNFYPKLNLEDFKQKLGVNEIPVLKVVREFLQIPREIPLVAKISNCNLPILQDEICCPLPDEHILAKITRKGELELHTEKCHKNRAIGLDKLSLITIINDTHRHFLAKLTILIKNLPGTFNKLSAIIASRQINMEEIFQERHENHDLVVVRLTITANSALQIEELLIVIAENDFVITATRA